MSSNKLRNGVYSLAEKCWLFVKVVTGENTLIGKNLKVKS